jgi:hypothetical protein
MERSEETVKRRKDDAEVPIRPAVVNVMGQIEIPIQTRPFETPADDGLVNTAMHEFKSPEVECRHKPRRDGDQCDLRANVTPMTKDMATPYSSPS